MVDLSADGASISLAFCSTDSDCPSGCARPCVWPHDADAFAGPLTLHCCALCCRYPCNMGLCAASSCPSAHPYEYGLLCYNACPSNYEMLVAGMCYENWCAEAARRACHVHRLVVC